MNKEKNILLAKRVGYTFIEDNVYHENEYDLFDQSTVLSKVEIVLNIHEDEYGIHRYFGYVKPKDPSRYRSDILERNDGRVDWDKEHYGSYIFLQDWNPEFNWNQLMQIAVAIKLKEVPSNIKEAYNKIYNLVSNHEQ